MQKQPRLNQLSLIADAYLKIALLLEQSCKLAAAIRHLEIPLIDTPHAHWEQIGRESLWENHAPHRFAELLEKAGLPFSNEERQLLKSLERVVAISSRYPASGRDQLLKDLTETVDVKNTFETAIKLAVRILKWSTPLQEVSVPKAAPVKICFFFSHCRSGPSPRSHPQYDRKDPSPSVPTHLSEPE